ncbi:unnamed protein product, partial [Discosporangium mesarthrocarpum]
MFLSSSRVVSSSSAERAVTVDVEVVPLAEAPVLSVLDAAPLGLEGRAADVVVSSVGLNDTDGAETLSVLVRTSDENLAYVAYGGAVADRSYDTALGLHVFQLPGELARAGNGTVEVHPSPGFSGRVSLEVVAVAEEDVSAFPPEEVEGLETTAETGVPVLVAVMGVADAASLSVSPLRVRAEEDSTTVLLLEGMALGDADGSESARLAVRCHDAELGSVTFSGVELEHGNGSVLSTHEYLHPEVWTNASLPSSGVLTVVAAADYWGELGLEVVLVTAEDERGLGAGNGSVLASSAESMVEVQVSLDPVADAPVLSLSESKVSVAEDSVVSLELKVSLADTDGSESLGLEVQTASAGIDRIDRMLNVFTAPPSLLAAGWGVVAVYPAADFGGEVTMAVVAKSYNESHSSGADRTAETEVDWTLLVAPVADVPGLAVAANPVYAARGAFTTLSWSGLTALDVDGSEAVTLELRAYGDSTGAILAVEHGGVAVAGEVIEATRGAGEAYLLPGAGAEGSVSVRASSSVSVELVAVSTESMFLSSS